MINTVGNGTVTKSPNKATYHYGEFVQLTASPDTGWSFSAWSGDLSGSVNPSNITIDGDKSVTATFIQNAYTLTVNDDGHGSASKNPDQASYNDNDVVTIIATPDPGYHFVNWTGDTANVANVNDASTTVTMHGNYTITANFAQNEYTLTINTVGSGTVTRNPDQATYHYGDIVQLTASPDTGWSFSAWSGDLSGSVNPSNIVINDNKTVTATFIQNEYTLTINTVGSGTVTRNPDQATYHYGDIVQLTASPSTGWSFSAWSGDLSGSVSPTNITIDGNKSVTATFIQPGSGGSAGGVGGIAGLTYLNEYMNDEGVFLVDTSVESEDGLVKITFPKGTIYRTSNGQPGHYITIQKLDPPSSAPTNTAFICFSYNIGPNESTFSLNAYLTFFYSDSMVQAGVAEEKLIIITWQDGKWIELEGCVVDPVKNTITVPLTHLTSFTVIAHTTAASFVASGMTITPAEVYPNEDITVSATITNAGDLTDNYTAVLKINGMSDQTETVTLKGGESQTITFTVTPTAAGSYTIQLGGLTGEFTVKETEPEGTVAGVPTPEVPKPSPTPTETKPSIVEPATPTQPVETPESPSETPTITPTQGISWRFIVVYAIFGVLAAGSVITYIILRRNDRK
jgi:uncharacterized repeat protein (TIGR02543 family)